MQREDDMTIRKNYGTYSWKRELWEGGTLSLEKKGSFMKKRGVNSR